MGKDSDGEAGLVLLVVGGMILVFLLAAVAQHIVLLLVIAAVAVGAFAAFKIAAYLGEQNARQREKDALEREQRQIHQDYLAALALVERMPSAEAFAQLCDAPYVAKCAELRLAPLDAPIRARLFERLSQAYRQAVAFPAYLQGGSSEVATRKINSVLGNPHIDDELAARAADAALAFTRRYPPLGGGDSQFRIKVSDLLPPVMEPMFVFADVHRAWAEGVVPLKQLDAVVPDDPEVEAADFAGLSVGFPLPPEARFRHHWICAASGKGKTTLLHALLTEDLKLVAQGKASLVLIDSKSELIEPIQSLKLFAPGQPLHGRLVVIEPDIDHPIAINPFKLSGAVADSNRQLGLDIQSMEFIKDAFSTITETPFSGKQEICFLNLLAILREIPGANIRTLKDLLSGHYAPYQDRLDQLHGDLRHFWEKQFNGREAIYKSTREEIGYRLDGMLIKSPMLKAILSSPVTKLDLHAEVAQAKVVVINTSQALLGVDGSCLFGRLFIAMIQHIAERRFLPGATKLPTFCYVDECGDYLKKEPKFAPILNRCRAANIGMILAHQDLAQISADVFSALSNAGVQMVNTYADAPAFARPMRCEPESLNKPAGQFAAMLRDARSSPVTIHVPDVDFRRAPRMSRDERRELWTEMHKRYCRSATSESAPVEEAWPNRDEDQGGPTNPERAPESRPKPSHEPRSEEPDIGPSHDY
jgi:hypothetical protein